MRSKKRRLIGAVVVILAAVFAACFSRELDTSTVESELDFGSNNGSSSCGSANVGSSIACSDVTITPLAGEHFSLIAAPDSTCAGFVITPPMPPVSFPYTLACLGSGSSGGVAAAPGSADSQGCSPTTYTVRATFTPQNPGTAYCSVNVLLVNVGMGGAMVTRTISYSGYGIPPPVALTVNPTLYNFQDVPIGGPGSSPVTVTVTNTGGQSTTVNITRTNTTNFWSDVPASQPLGAGGSFSFNVRCTPTQTGALTGMIMFNASAGNATAMQTLTLDCNGIVSDVTIDPSPVAFPSSLVGGEPRTQTVEIVATASTTLTSVGLALQHSPDLVIEPPFGGPIGLGPGSSYTVTLRHTPTQAHAEGPLGTLVVVTSGGSRSVAITGEALAGKVAAAPGAIEFGPVCMGATATATFEVFAETAASFNLMEVVDPASPFHVSSTEFTSPHPLRGNHANAVTFTAMVQPTEPGDITASALVMTNLPGDEGLPIALHVNAMPTGVSPTPTAVNFGPNPILTPTIARKVVVTNCEEAPISITAARIVGANADEFKIVNPGDPRVEVPAKGQLELLVVMSPKTAGAKIAQLELDHASGMVTADLEGTAFGPDLEKGTYYSCSAGAGAGLAPFGVALVILRRRRRRT